MATVLDIITRAFRKTGIGQIGETLTADMQAEGLDALNMLIAAWALEGVTLPSAALVQDDVFPFADKYQEGVVYMLASRISPDYMVPMTFDPERFMRLFRTATMAITAVTIPGGLTRMPSQMLRSDGGF